MLTAGDRQEAHAARAFDGEAHTFSAVAWASRCAMVYISEHRALALLKWPYSESIRVAVAFVLIPCDFDETLGTKP